MNPLAVFAVLLGLVALATVIGLIWRARTGRVRGIAKGETVIRLSELSEDALGGSGATLLQFSTEVCAPCVRTHAILGALAAETPRVSHVDVDVTRRPDIASRFNLLQSPTTFILDGRGVVRARIGGAPRKAEVAAELQRILGTTATATVA
jgi:thiol-disulfide isomerase/thioredoxin